MSIIKRRYLDMDKEITKQISRPSKWKEYRSDEEIVYVYNKIKFNDLS